MLDRLSKIVLAAAISFFFSLVVFDNLTDYSANFAYVQHVMSMDTIFPDSQLQWRAITNPTLHHLFFNSIIVSEITIMVLCWWGVGQLVWVVRSEAAQFNQAKAFLFMGLTLSCLLWLVAFLGVGGEWFLMWQSTDWNGQPIAFQMFTITGIVLLLVRQPDIDI
jgi:predicted small integral membrane protein